jgi:DNA (cytosine-5)-methyltransferase 1
MSKILAVNADDLLMKPISKTPKTGLSAVELFAGAGGLALGLARAGFKYASVIESNGPACETLRLNKENGTKHIKDWQITEADVARIGFADCQGVDLLSGGPPCQPFSQAGTRNGRTDLRDMFPHFIRAVREAQPKSFIVENVKGLLTTTFSMYFNYIVHQLRFPLVTRKHGEKWKEHRARLEKLYTSGKHNDLQYKVIFQSLQATDFGVPQHRERVFVVGVRADLGLEYSFPLPTHSREALFREQWVTKSYWERHNKRHRRTPESVKNLLTKLEKRQLTTQPWRTVRDAIADLPKIGVGRTSRHILNHFLNRGARVYHGHDGSLLDMPAKTIKAGYHGVPGGENILKLDCGTVRYFSVRECARLQTFPDDWGFDGSWTRCMRQVGNAVPVSLAEAVAAPLATALRSKS